MSRPNSICFGLLAGGESRRMGTDKASLLWRGQPLWKHQLRLADEIGASEILVSGRQDGPYENVRIVNDEAIGCGPIAGISALLAEMKSDWLVVAGVDMPFLDAITLRSVLALRDEGRGVVPVLDGRAQALAAVYPRAVALLAREHVAAKDKSLQAFVRTSEAAGFVQLVNWKASDAFRSLNTPEEWAEATKD